MSASLEIQCPGCGERTWLLREPVYDGFVKCGEKLKCSGCGHDFAEEEDVPFVKQKAAAVFDSADHPDDPQVFKGERVRFCRHCKHYVVNPFTQWCGLHRKEVEATDVCDQFTEKEREEESIP
jgi:hypothetical protein